MKNQKSENRVVCSYCTQTMVSLALDFHVDHYGNLRSTRTKSGICSNCRNKTTLPV